MISKSNIHTHCTYCDGKNTIEEMIQAALDLGFESIGFSSHAVGVSVDGSCMKADMVDSYFNELEAMKSKYQQRIKIYKGLELELGYSKPDGRCDYTIGAVHFLDTPNGINNIDYSPSVQAKGIMDTGGPDAYARLYFETLVQRSMSQDYDIQAHFDLLTKFDEKNQHFTYNSSYRRYAFDALDALSQKSVIFEINTGAISRGYTTKAYPADFILKRMAEKKLPIILSSDAHSSSALACCFDETEQRLRYFGFSSMMKLTDKGFVETAL